MEAVCARFHVLLRINLGVYQGFFEMITGAPALGTIGRAVRFAGEV
jgi:hypothetical protein